MNNCSIIGGIKLAHNHDHHHHGSTDNIKFAFFLNFTFTILEVIGGFWTNSTAILSDALHDLGDSISLGLAWYIGRFSKKEADFKFSFGYSRFSLLGAFINSLVLIVGSILIIMRAVPKIINPEPINEEGMIIFALVGIIVNGIAVLRLRKGKSINEKVVSWHLLEDVLGWLAILIVSIILFFKDIYILDPLLSIGITFYVLYNVIKNLKVIGNIFLQRVPEGLSIEAMEDDILQIENITDVHHTHMWSLDGEKNMLSTHIVIEKGMGQEEIICLKNKLRELVYNRDINHVTVEVDYVGEECTCENCEY